MVNNINPNISTSQSQKNRILAYLLQGNSITPLEALYKFNSFRLGARIAEIKAEGYEVQRELVKDAKTGKRYAKYSLLKEYKND